jgi:hypothetical protein
LQAAVFHCRYFRDGNPAGAEVITVIYLNFKQFQPITCVQHKSARVTPGVAGSTG